MKTIFQMFYFILIIGMSLFVANVCWAQDSTATTEKTSRIDASGTFAPLGPPKAPQRISVGKSCIVDLIEPYTITGALSGKIVFNYRILVKGPCGSPPGTFDEEWIAYGKFKGNINGTPMSGNMSYSADVKAGGEVNGSIVLGQGLEGELSVHGNFKDGKLSYEGWVK